MPLPLHKSSQIQHFMAGNYTHFPPADTQWYHNGTSSSSPCAQREKMGSHRPPADPRIFLVSFTRGRTWIRETSDTRFGKTSTQKRLKAALPSSGCASILPQRNQHSLRIKVICLEQGWIKAHAFFFLSHSPDTVVPHAFGRKMLLLSEAVVFF